MSVAGVSVTEWLNLWRHCHSIIEGSPCRVQFPNGESLDDQAAVLVAIFEIIEDEWRKAVKEQIERGTR